MFVWPLTPISETGGIYIQRAILDPARTSNENIGLRMRVRTMNKNDPVSLKSVSYMMIGGGAVALALVAAVWGILGIFVI